MARAARAVVDTSERNASAGDVGDAGGVGGEPKRLRVLVIDEDKQRAAILEAGLLAANAEIAAIVAPSEDLAVHVRAVRPDIIIVDMDSPSRDTLESMRAINRDQPLPIVMFVDSADSSLIEAAMRAGVSAYVIDGLAAKRVKPVLDVAIARFKEVQGLRAELAKTKASLGERKVIERAKGLLMQQRGMSEDDAFRALRKLAMDKNQRLVEVAQALLTYAQLLKP
jgi:response regulator NasT